MSQEPKYSRNVSATYQIIIVVGFLILFLQLYALASSLFKSNQLTSHIEEFKRVNAEKEESIKNKQLESLKLLLDNVQIRNIKETQNMVFRDEEVHIIQDSEYLANSEKVAPDEEAVFKQPLSESIFINTESSRVEKLKKRPNIDQWKYFLFGVE